MKKHRKLAHSVLQLVTVLALVWCVDRPIEATPPEGVSFIVLNRATVPEFDARRKFREAIEQNEKGHKNWKIELEATRMIDVVTVAFFVEPGGHGGWHTHPGPAILTVSEGTLTMYDGDDPSCTPQDFPAGTGSIEAEDDRHIHMLRNETEGVVAVTIVTFLVPVGAPLRIDLPDPGNCPF
jgi:mannose-6-phosphate isomerase-like protein (cupin superfamily)